MLRLPPNARRYFQIGPRIRVGGSVGKLGQKVKIGVGKLAENKWVDAGLGLIPGVGAPISAAVNAAGHVLDTSGGGIHTWGDVGRDALDAGEAYAAGMGGNAVRDVAGNVIKHGFHALSPRALVSTVKHVIPGLGGDDNPTDNPGDPGLIDSLTKHGKGLLKDLGGGGGLVDKALMAAAMAQTAADREKQARMIDEATKYATQSYDARTPLRTQALGALTDPGSAANKTSDLSSIYANPGSVYDQQRRGTLGASVPMGG